MLSEQNSLGKRKRVNGKLQEKYFDYYVNGSRTVYIHTPLWQVVPPFNRTNHSFLFRINHPEEGFELGSPDLQAVVLPTEPTLLV